MDSEMAISPRSLFREIVCPICLDILNQTRAAPDCLHRFCKKCVEKVVKKDCPVCGKKLPSQVKSFREDTKFDLLINKIYNGNKASKPSDSNKGTTSFECELVLKHITMQQTRYLKCPENTTVGHLERYLAIRPDGSRMPDLENNESYHICIERNHSTGHYERLKPEMKIEDIRKNYNLATEQPLELFYYNPKSA